MRRRRKRKSRVILIFSSLIAVTAAGIGYKSIPGLAEAAGRLGEVKVGFESDPKNYTGEMDFNFQSINGEDEILSSGYGWHEEQEEVSNTESDSEAGPKP